MLSVEERTKFFNHVILFLAHPDNRGKEFIYSDIASLLEIPKEYQEHVLNSLMSSNGYINGKPSFKSPPISIAPNGIKYADELEEKYFNSTGLPIFTKFINMTILDTCELIFQKHKESQSYSLMWLKDTFKPETPSGLNEAKDIMLHKEVIFKGSHNITTILNDLVHNARSYSEAVSIIEENKRQQHIAYYDHSVKTMGDNSPVAQHGAKLNQTVKKIEKPKNWFLKIIDDIKNAAVSHIIVSGFSLIVGVVGTKWLSPKPTLSTSQQKQQSNKVYDSSNKDSILLDNFKGK